MSQPGYISTLLGKISREGSSVLTFEFSGLQHKIRLYAAAQPTILSAIKTPPSHDEDLAPMVDKLRHRIKRYSPSFVAGFGPNSRTPLKVCVLYVRSLTSKVLIGMCGR